jgi:phosphoglycolate phosphatase
VSELEKTLVLFDLDGTLLPDSETHAKAFSVALKGVLGIDARLNEIQFSGLTDRLILVELAKIHGVDELETRSKMTELTRTMIEYSRGQIATEAIVPLPGVRQLLERLTFEHVVPGIVTGSFEPIAIAKLGQAKIANFFRSGIGGFGTDSENRVEIIELAISKAKKLIDTKLNAIYVGDTPRDVKAGHSANLKVIAVATGRFSVGELQQSGADLILRDLTESNTFIRFLKISHASSTLPN